MTDESRLDGALQENVLTLLCFNDKFCQHVRAAIRPALFESSVFREVAGHAIDFIDTYGEAIKDHLPDHLEHILQGEDARKARTYRALLENLFASKDTVNAEYVVKQLQRFVRLQGLKSTVIAATEALNDGRVDEAETLMQKGLSAQIVTFDGGLDLSSPEAVAGILDEPEEEGFDLGIPELDSRGIIPRRKELFLFLAARGRGKSWFAGMCAKQAILQRWSVLIVTLEMSERRYGARMLQAFFSLTRRKAELMLPRLVKDKDGNLLDITKESIERPAMLDPDARGIIMKRATREFRKRAKLRIKQFPTHSLDMAGLRAYLDSLQRFENFTPDCIIIDYPDLMKHDPKNLRAELGATIASIRGIGVERNAATIVLSQGNREAERAKTVTGDMAAEDISKLATADTALTYSQTPVEHKLGLGRLFAEKARNEESKMQVLITQGYAIGQFCLDSKLMDADDWEMIDSYNESKRRRRRRDDDDDDGDD